VTDSSAVLGEVKLRRRLEAVASLAVVEDDGWDALQERLARTRSARLSTLKPLAAVAAAVLVLGVIVLAGHDPDGRVTTADTTTTTGDDSAVSTSTTTADPGTRTSAPLDPGDAPAGPAPGGLAGPDGAPAGGARGTDPGAVPGVDPGGTGSPSPGGTSAVTDSTGTMDSSAPPASTPPPVTAPTSGADLEVSLDAVRTDVVTFTSTVINHGPDIAPAAWLAIEVEETVLVNFVRSTVGSCTISPDGGLVFICQFGDLAPGGSATVTLEAQVLAPAGTPLNATVTTGSSAPDPVGPGSSASTSIPA
jgi:hypothetical protein